MTHFTQLDLSGEPDRKPKQETVRKTSGAGPGSHSKMFSGGQKTAVTVCSIIAMSLLGISLLETGGCSKAADKSQRITAPTPAASSQIMPSPVADTPQPAAIMAKKPVKKSRQHTLVASTYSNPVYGVTFRYPKPYGLKEGDKANQEWEALKPAQMNFVQPGGTTISAVELPERLYRGTDLASAFFNVSVNTNLTPAQCAQFASSESSHADASPSQDDESLVPVVLPVEPPKVTEVAEVAEVNAAHSNTKYYHVFQNGACYEFALGIATKDGLTSGTKAVKQDEVFRRLNWMLSTVKIQAAGVPEQVTQSGASMGGGKE